MQIEAAERKRARLAFIGCGNFATARIFPQIPLIPEIDLMAVCDLDREKAERNARNFGARRVYTDMHRMLDDEELDGVFVIGPAPQQAALAPAVLARGLPVYVEKPSAVTSAQARELAAIAERHGTWGQVGFMKRFADVYTIAKEVVGRPEFGELHVVKCKFGQGPYPQIWGIDSAKRAMLIGQLVHLFDLVRFFGGEVRQVHALFRPVTENQFAWAVNLRFASGAVGQMDLNSLDTKAAFRDIIEELELIGLSTHVRCEDMLRVTYLPRESWSNATPHTGRFEHTFNPSWTGVGNGLSMFGYTGEVRHFARKCLGQVDGGPTLWDSYRALQLAEAVYESTERGEAVELPGE
jgi:myo-inositol 2-dehydrogenase/D-chiro-inositol 1-dehydrogenase